MKRGFDIVFSFIGLLLLMPLSAVIAVLIKLDSRGPVFFIQKRTGRNFKPFNLYKFRTMVTDASQKGLQITAGGDRRITGTGRFLRKTKLDELPQLINVLKGEMSLVGPRPEMEKYVNKYREEYEDILKVRPGITDVASLAFSNEEEILKEQKDPEEYYIHVLLPQKIRISSEYVTNASLSFDIQLIFMTLFKLVYPSGRIKKTIEFLTPHRKPIVIGIQSIIFVVSNYLAFSIRFEGDIGPYFELFVRFIPLLLLIRISLLFMFSMDKGLWRYVSLEDFMKLGLLVTVGTMVFFVTVRFGFGYTSYPLSIYFGDWFLNIIFLGGIRAMRRLNRVNENGDEFHISGKKRLVVIGAGDAAEMFIRDILRCSYYAYKVVGLIDDNPNKKGLTIRDIPILGTRKDLKDILRSEQVDELLIAMPAAPKAVFKEVVKDIRQHGLPIKTLPSLWNILNGKESTGSIKPVEPEDVLFRKPLNCSSAGLKSLIRGKRVMVTGAGGSIGSELSRQILSYNPEKLILFERHEESLFKIDGELRSSLDLDTAILVTSVIGDILDEERVSEVLGKYEPQIVFHAAAYKHVPLMEDNPYEAFKTNVIGTRIMAQKSGESGVEKFVMISTDKAVNSVNVMGMTKKIAEDIVRAFMEERDLFTSTKYMIVRFGNVLGSSGSVVPHFREQIKHRGPVTVTHPDITRYFMTIPEAVNLVLQASVKGNGGEIFVLDMGKPVKILDLAKRMISLYGYKPGIDIDITFTGLRPGEKLYEELFSSDERRETTTDAKIMMAIPGQSNRYVFETLKTLNFDNVRDKDDIACIYSKLANGQRDHKRLNLALELSYYTDGRDRIGLGMLNNISFGGFSSNLKQYFKSGAKMDIRISTNGDEVQMNLDVPAKVVWSRKENNGYKYGFKFAHSGEDQVKTLRDYIEKLYPGGNGGEGRLMAEG